MDTITHAISGAVIGAATALPAREGGGTLRQRAMWGALFAAFPDSDSIVALFVNQIDYLVAHRGITHSVILLPLWAALLGWLGAKAGGHRWREMAMLAALALAVHICGDLITSYGTRMFAPLWDAPLAMPITFIIDPIFSSILLVGLVAALWKHSVIPARASYMVLLAYLGMQTVLHFQAAAIGETHAADKGMSNPVVIAFPQPFSPFNWKVVVVSGEEYHRGYVNLLADKPYRPGEDAGFVRSVFSAYRPVDDVYWQAYPRFPREDSLTRDLALSAWQQPEFSAYREFALLPYVSEVSGDSTRVCVWFTDLRFTLPELRHPFEYAMCRGEQGEWSLQLERGEGS